MTTQKIGFESMDTGPFNTFAAPVLLGIMLKEAALPPLQSFIDGPSTVFCVAESHRAIEPQINKEILTTLKQKRKINNTPLTSDGMDSGHKTLNNTKFVMDDLSKFISRGIT